MGTSLSSEQEMLLSIGLKYRGKPPAKHWMPYVQHWLDKWDEASEDLYASYYVVWC